MDWIEKIFHVSPDAGNGSLETAFLMAPLAALLIGCVVYIWLRQRNK
jgi:hypothetical protein